MIVSLPTPDGPLMMTSRAPGAPSMTSGVVTPSLPAGDDPADASPARSSSRTVSSSGGQRRLGAHELRARRRHELEPPRVEEQPLEAVRAPARVPVP